MCSHIYLLLQSQAVITFRGGEDVYSTSASSKNTRLQYQTFLNDNKFQLSVLVVISSGFSKQPQNCSTFHYCDVIHAVEFHSPRHLQMAGFKFIHPKPSLEFPVLIIQLFCNRLCEICTGQIQKKKKVHRLLSV